MNKSVSTIQIVKALFILGIFLASTMFAQAQQNVNPPVPLHVGGCGFPRITVTIVMVNGFPFPQIVPSTCSYDQYKEGKLGLDHNTIPSPMGTLDVEGEMHVFEDMAVMGEGFVMEKVDVGASPAVINSVKTSVDGDIASTRLNSSMQAMSVSNTDARVCANSDGQLVICGIQLVNTGGSGGGGGGIIQ